MEYEMDRIFDQNYIGNLCEELKQAVNSLKNQMSVMEGVADHAISAMNQVPSDVMDSSIESAAGTLKSRISDMDMDGFLRKIGDCETRATRLIPAADSQYREQTEELLCTIHNIKEAVAEIREFLMNTPLTMSNRDFAVAYEAMHEKCSSSLENADARMDRILGNIKGAEKISTVFSKDPVNLSTGNFIYEYDDIEIPGIMPFKFSRFYNSINHRKGVLGKDWNHNYEVHIFKENNELVLIREEGKEEHFIKTSTEELVSVYHTGGTLSETEAGYLYETIDCIKYYFDKEGYCLKKENSEHINITFTYMCLNEGQQCVDNKMSDNKRLVKVERNTGEAFTLEYGDKGYLSSVTDHVGRKISYQVEDDLLQAVSTFGGHWNKYVYSTEGKLKSVINARGVITVENEYDSKMRTTLQKFPDGSQMSYEYDDEKREVELTERNGSKITYVHDKQFRDIRHIYSDGEERFEYNKLNKRTLVVDKLGNKTQFGYDSKGNVTRIINALGVKTELQYNEHSKPTYVAINGREKIRNYYDEAGNLTGTKDALGNMSKLEYDSKERPSKFIQPDGSELKLTYDERGNIASLTDNNGGVIKYVYDALNQVVETTDRNGNVTKYEYDINGNIKKVINAVGAVKKYEYNETNKVTKITDFDGSTICREYNSLNLLSKNIDQLGRETSFTYDVMWNLARVVQPDGSKTTYLYDEHNHLGRIRNANGDVVRYTYDANGNRTGIEDELGNKTRLAYDALGRIMEAEGPDGTKVNYEYDCEGHVTKVTDSFGNYVHMIYNEGGQLIKESNQNGESRIYTYTKIGKMESILDEYGHVTKYVYDLGGQIREVLFYDGTNEKYAYDANGNVIQYINKKGYKLSYEYDCLNQLIAISDEDSIKEQYFYDSVGNVICKADAFGNKTLYEYSLTGQLIKMTDACGNQIEYQYDERDQLLSVCQYGEFADKDNSLHENCQITSYERNPMGQVTKVTDAMGNSETFGYDKRGRLIEKIDKEGYITKYGYNVNGDINHIQYSDGREVKLSYNPLRQLQEIEDWVGITRIETDVRGRITKVTNPKGESVSYSYMANGQRESIIYPDDTKVEYKYDEYGRLASMVQDGKTFTYGYDLLGQICQKTYPNGIKTAYDYTSKGEILNLIHSDEKGILEQYTYSYDVLGNKTSIEKKRRGLEGESGIYEYKYDAVGRLASIVKDGVNLRSYTYDAFGNRTSLKEKNNKTNYLYNALNQLVVKADMQGETTYKYDRRGNLSSVWKDGIVRNQYAYGAINRLEQAVNSNGESARYVYNGLGYRVGKEVENDLNPVRRIEYVLDLTRGYNNLLQKREDAAVQKYLWDGSITALFDEECSEEMYYLVDELGSPMRLLDFEGNIINTFGYDEFGQDIYANQMDRQPFGYTGYQTDIVAGLYFAQAREYDSSTGRFGAVDPYRGELDNGDTLNSYIYCLNNPLLYFDPWGLAPAWLEGIWVHIQIESELKNKKFACLKSQPNVRIPGAGLGVTGLGIADFVVYRAGYVEIYEIKPATYSTGYLNGLANEQLDRYVKYYGLSYGTPAVRGIDVFGDSVPYYKDPTRTLTYWTSGNGLIYYSLSPKLEPEKKIVVESESILKIEDKKQESISLITIGTCTLALLYTVGTLLEDAATYGAGTTDDFTIPLIWQWALSF